MNDFTVVKPTWVMSVGNKCRYVTRNVCIGGNYEIVIIYIAISIMKY